MRGPIYSTVDQRTTHGALAQTVSSVPVTPACRIVVEGNSKQLLGVGEKCAAQVALPRILRPLNQDFRRLVGFSSIQGYDTEGEDAWTG